MNKIPTGRRGYSYYYYYYNRDYYYDGDGSGKRRRSRRGDPSAARYVQAVCWQAVLCANHQQDQSTHPLRCATALSPFGLRTQKTQGIVRQLA
jgi:hypothetical protein